MNRNKIPNFKEIVGDIRQIIALHNEKLIHISMINNILNGLNRYKEFLQSFDFSHKVYSESDDKIFETLKGLLSEFISFMIECSEANQVKTILNKTFADDVQFIDNFRKKFNKYIISLKLFRNYVFPISEDQRQDNADKRNDILLYKNIIMREISTCTDQNKINIFNIRMNEIKELDENIAKIDAKIKEELIEAERKIGPNEIEGFLGDFKSFFISINDIKIQYEVGHGAEGVVHLGYHKSTNCALAVKKLIKQQFTVDTCRRFKREISIIANLDHFAILHFVGICTTPYLCFVNEYMAGGSLYERLRDRTLPPLSPTKRTIIAIGVAHALKYLHSKNILHCDIKSLNVLLNSDDYPKLCDFGLCRFIDEPTDFKLGGFGTVNWMAPEVIRGEECTTKSDVFSYGVLIWEILTDEIPYSDKNGDQIRDEVAFYNTRPKIPPNCPQNLNVLMRNCWAKDPKVRPDFNKIIEYFEKGVYFTGSDQDQVKAYISQYEKITQDGYVDFGNFSSATLRTICNDLDKDMMSAITKLNKIFLSDKLIELVRQSKVIHHLSELIARCSSPQTAILLNETINVLIKKEVLFREFEAENGCLHFLNMFAKYGTTSMPNVMEYLLLFVKNQDLNICSDIIVRISPFLLSTDLSSRLNSLELLNEICDKKCYDSQNSFSSIIRNVLANVFYEAMPELAIQALRLLSKFARFAELNSPTLVTEGIMKTVEMLSHRNNDTVQILHQRIEVIHLSLKVIKNLLKNSITQTKVVTSILDAIPTLAQSGDCKILRRSLVILALLLKTPSTIVEISSKPDTIESFRTFFKSNDNEIVIYSLKLCFAFLSNSVNEFLKISDSIFPLLENRCEAISMLSASCLTLVFQKQPFAKVSQNQYIEHFLRECFSKDEIPIPALNLCGTISTSIEGSMYIDSMDILQSIIKCFKNNNNNNNDINIKLDMILASFSSMNPMYNHLTNFIPFMFDKISNNINAPYPIIFIANMALTNEGAIECANNIDIIIKNVKIDFYRSLKAIERTLYYQDAKSILEGKNMFEVLIPLLKMKLDDGKILFSIINEISISKSGQKAILESGLFSDLQQKFVKLALHDESRPLLLQTLSRMRKLQS